MVRFLGAVLLVGVVLIGALKLAGAQLPILDYPLGGPLFTQPHIEIVDPDDIP
ncbi:MAG TPA: hypothetical protein VLD61_05095 [Methylomirabilota bacterium]|nr:hypothetical protein [Methylomirabilota bacterium]